MSAVITSNTASYSDKSRISAATPRLQARLPQPALCRNSFPFFFRPRAVQVKFKCAALNCKLAWLQC